MSTNIKLSPDQAAAMSQVMSWAESDEKVFTFGGLAGTGKSTLIQALVNRIGAEKIEVCAFTGKAVSVLRLKGLPQARTIHNLLYRPVGEDEETGDPIFQAKHLVEADIVIVDEASMVNKRLDEDLQRAARKILYVGDHGQLEPIGGDPGLMHSPNVTLEKIHRQAEKSPIIRFAHGLRLGEDPFDKTYLPEEKSSALQVSGGWPKDLHTYDAIIVGKNAYRRYLNNHVRDARGFQGEEPQKGEILICLQNNSYMGIFNGMQVIVKNFQRETPQVGLLTFVEEGVGLERHVPMFLPQLGSSENYGREQDIREDYGLFDWGYALTAHKAQGSGWRRGCVIEKRDMPSNWDLKRWRYTAATRFSEELFYVIEGRREEASAKESKNTKRSFDRSKLPMNRRVEVK